ncbi:MAG: class I SAM-dependent methyltransferase [Bacilli bacterium]|nr:class I SAM-dependent methyltransferase [Bacilli bacterium]
MRLIKEFNDYKIIDMASGMKLEKWGSIKLLRPDPQIIWDKKSFPELWNDIDAVYHRSNTGGGHWEIRNKNIPEHWLVNYQDLKLNIKLMNFKHTGLFPEQATNWEFLMNLIKESNRKVKVLNLFAYTGAATVAALSAGASVVHIDSSRGMVDWAKENVISSGLQDKEIRYIVDDVVKFVKREIRRGNKYDVILMDPPSFGRGSKNEVWNIEKDLGNLVELCSEILSDNPLLFLINSYSTGLSMSVMADLLKIYINSKYKGYIYNDEIGISMENSDLVLPCGVTTMWVHKECSF